MSSARVTSSLFVSALIRRINGVGGHAQVLRHGNDQSGAVFLAFYDRSTRTIRLYETAMDFGAYDEESADRRFRLSADGLTELDLSDRVERESKFDPDVWFVEIENCPIELSDLISLKDDQADFR